MLKIIRNLLKKIKDSIDFGNTNISGAEAIQIIDEINEYSK